MLVLTNARVATMTGPQAAAGEGPLAIIEHGAVACDGDRVAYVGGVRGAPEGDQRIDAQGALLTPGVVDPHTHLVFAGDRANDPARRLAGATYLEIAHAGGGILSTVRATRAASDEQLLAGARERLGRPVPGGGNTVGGKRGHGLSGGRAGGRAARCRRRCSGSMPFRPSWTASSGSGRWSRS